MSYPVWLYVSLKVAETTASGLAPPITIFGGELLRIETVVDEKIGVKLTMHSKKYVTAAILEVRRPKVSGGDPEITSYRGNALFRNGYLK